MADAELECLPAAQPPPHASAAQIQCLRMHWGKPAFSYNPDSTVMLGSQSLDLSVWVCRFHLWKHFLLPSCWSVRSSFEANRTCWKVFNLVPRQCFLPRVIASVAPTDFQWNSLERFGHIGAIWGNNKQPQCTNQCQMTLLQLEARARLSIPRFAHVAKDREDLSLNFWLCGLVACQNGVWTANDLCAWPAIIPTQPSCDMSAEFLPNLGKKWEECRKTSNDLQLQLGCCGFAVCHEICASSGVKGVCPSGRRCRKRPRLLVPKCMALRKLISACLVKVYERPP